MFIVIADIKLKPESVDDFKRWFSESNRIISKFDGFVSRRLLEAENCHHKVMVEFEDMEKFKTMHQSPEHMKVHSEAVSFMDGMPSPAFYKVAAQ